jgi:hypothetical protein
MKTRKKPSPPAKWKTPKTDDFLCKTQSEAVPFEISFYQLLDLTRTLEKEAARLRAMKKNAAHP